MKAKRFAIAFGIAVLLPLVVHYGVSTFVKKPHRDDYRIEDYSQKYSKATADEKKDLQAKKDDLYKQKKIDRKRFQKVLFYIGTPIGIIAVIVGVYLPIPFLGAGLVFGGIFTIGNSYSWHWSNIPDGIRFLSLLIMFVILIFVGYKKLNSPGKEK